MCLSQPHAPPHLKTPKMLNRNTTWGCVIWYPQAIL